MYSVTAYPSPVGVLTLGCSDDALVGVWWRGQEYFPDAHPGDVVDRADTPVFTKTRKWLDRYFAGGRPEISSLPLVPAGGEFRRAVWGILCEIPHGELTTYGAIAKRMAGLMHKPRMSAQAVGGAVGHNPISIIIPCHRVVGADGSLTGYGGGLAQKVKLLELEGVDMSKLFMPVEATGSKR